MSEEGETPREPIVPGAAQRDEEARRRREQETLDRLQKEIEEVESYRMPLMEHLIELRDRLLWVAGAIGIGTSAGLYYARDLFEVLSSPFIRAMTESGRQHQVSGLVMAGPFEAMSVWFRVGLIAGMILASPIVSWHVWQFVAPGLYRTERRMVGPLSLASVALFLLGAGFCFYVIFPYAFPFFIQVLDVEPMITADSYISAVFWMMAAFGLCFQMPIGAFFLARLGLVDAKDLWGSTRYAIVVIFVVAAVLTPPDPLTQILLAVPMCLLWLVSIGIVAMFSTKGQPRPEGEEPPAAVA